jgi:hypothetical protein
MQKILTSNSTRIGADEAIDCTFPDCTRGRTSELMVLDTPKSAVALDEIEGTFGAITAATTGAPTEVAFPMPSAAASGVASVMAIGGEQMYRVQGDLGIFSIKGQRIAMSGVVQSSRL